MSEPVCEHGSQQRKCPHCENSKLDARVAELEQECRDLERDAMFFARFISERGLFDEYTPWLNAQPDLSKD